MIRELDWSSAIGLKVDVYRNLNNGRMSLRHKGKVIGHVTDCIIQCVTFHVSESGRQRVIRDKRKNVHAWGKGILIAQFDDSVRCPIQLGYDPYTNDSFVKRGTIIPIHKCNFLVVRHNQVWVSPDAVLVGDKPTLTIIESIQQNLFPLQLEVA